MERFTAPGVKQVYAWSLDGSILRNPTSFVLVSRLKCVLPLRAFVGPIECQEERWVSGSTPDRPLVDKFDTYGRRS